MMTNRKHISHKPYIIHDSVKYKVNPGKVGSPTRYSGIFTPIMHKMLDELLHCEQVYKRVFVVQFQLHHKDRPTVNNTDISLFFKRIKQKIQRAYDVRDIGHCWVREHDKAKAQHYHCCLFLDGDKIRYSEKLFNELLIPTWNYIHPDNHLQWSDNPFYFYHWQSDPDTKRDCIYHLSYMAKGRDKGVRPLQTKDYGSSRLGTARNLLNTSHL